MRIDFTLPARWLARHYWRSGKVGANGFTIAIGPVFAIGVEIINLAETKGLALMVGPFWIAYAQYRPIDAPLRGD